MHQWTNETQPYSPMCISTGCIIEKEMAYPGNDIDIGGKERYGGTKVENQEACAKLSLSSGASYWAYYQEPRSVCFVKTSKSNRKSNPTSVAGNSECGIVGKQMKTPP